MLCLRIVEYWQVDTFDRGMSIHKWHRKCEDCNNYCNPKISINSLHATRNRDLSPLFQITTPDILHCTYLDTHNCYDVYGGKFSCTKKGIQKITGGCYSLYVEGWPIHAGLWRPLESLGKELGLRLQLYTEKPHWRSLLGPLNTIWTITLTILLKIVRTTKMETVLIRICTMHSAIWEILLLLTLLAERLYCSVLMLRMHHQCSSSI